MEEASKEAKNTIAFATSSGCPQRPKRKFKNNDKIFFDQQKKNLVKADVKCH